LLAGEKLNGDEREHRLVTIIRDEAEKLAELIQSFLQASALTGFDSDAESEEIDTEMLLRHTVAPLRDLAAERQVGLAIRLPSGLKGVRCRPDATQTALRAVVKNAIEFSDGGGTVTLEVRRTTRDGGHWVSIRVVDRGVGVPEEELHRVFDSFWRGRHAARSNARGVGLGLAIARRIVEAQGGVITIQSARESGTEVTISLPQ
jgi:signal transduction histidine kinase